MINTPSIIATKWWPGDLGRHSSHAIVFARLLVGENDYGVQPFHVQLRDLDTWKHLPGVETGDMGPKFGYASKDNGYGIFKDVRIPRTNMLMGFCELDKEGNFEITGDLRVLYSVMMFIRVQIVGTCGMSSLKVAQSTVRYSSVRRQFKTYQGIKDERKILDYQT